MMNIISNVTVQPGLCPGPRQRSETFGIRIFLFIYLSLSQTVRNGAPPPFRTKTLRFLMFCVLKCIFHDKSPKLGQIVTLHSIFLVNDVSPLQGDFVGGITLSRGSADAPPGCDISPLRGSFHVLFYSISKTIGYST